MFNRSQAQRNVWFGYKVKNYSFAPEFSSECGTQGRLICFRGAASGCLLFVLLSFILLLCEG